MKQISFETTKEDSTLIRGIVKRAADDWGASGHELDRLACSMDITACHASGCPLRLSELLEAPAYDFAHDVSGIMRHLNRKTGKLGGCFLPRFSAPEPVAV